MSRHRLALSIFLAATSFGAPAVARAQLSAPRWRLVEERRLDGAQEGFTELTEARIGPRGQIIAVLHEDNHLWFYDSTATHHVAVGDIGHGPGEFVNLTRFGWVADTVWILDDQLKRISFFSRTGTFLRSRDLPELPMPLARASSAGQLRTLSPGAVLADGTVLAQATVMNGASAGGRGETETVIARLSGPNTVRVVAASPDPQPPMVRVTVGRGQSATTVPFVARPLIAFSVDGSLYAFLTTDITSAAGGTYTLRAFTPDGAIHLERTYPFTGVPISPQSIDTAVATMTERFAGRGSSETVAQLAAQVRARIPAAYPPVVSMFLGLDGTTWISLRPSSDGSVTLVLDEHGDVIGSVRAPARSVIIAGSRTNVWFSERTTGKPINVVRYRVVTP